MRFPGLENFRQFILQRDRVPLDPIKLQPADAHNSQNWLTYESALLLSQQRGTGIGFVFTHSDPFFFVDIDDALTETGWSDIANEITAMFRGAFMEVSMSGKGLHIIGRGKPNVPHRNKNTALHIELYTQRRFVALTGQGATGDATYECQSALDNLIDKYFAELNTEPLAEWTTKPCQEWSGPDDDTELLELATQIKTARSMLGHSPTFQELWTASPTLGKFYPHSENPFDHSSADLALCCHLAYLTGKDCDRIDRLFRMSALYRSKWEREDYRYNTITQAITQCRGVLNVSTRQDKDYSRDDIIPYNRLVDFFNDTYFVSQLDRFVASNGEVLSTHAFDMRCGRKIFCLDSAGQTTTNKASEAFRAAITLDPTLVVASVTYTCNTAYRSIDTNGKLNLWSKPMVKSAKGDAGIFKQHIAMLLPNEQDQHYLLWWLARVLQRPGEKILWAPVIQGAQGNGKTLIAEVMCDILGPEHSIMLDGTDIKSDYNDWIEGRIFVAIEELYVNDRLELLDKMKPYITGRTISVRKKFINTYSIDNMANFYCTTNHRDAIHKTDNDRRFWFVYTAQQGYNYKPDERWFSKLHAWKNNRRNIEALAHYLLHYPTVDEYHQAPVASMHEDIKRESMPEYILTLQQAIEQEAPGMRNGLISTVQVTKALRGAGPRKVAKALEVLGYIRLGKLSNVSIIDDGKRPYIYGTPDKLHTDWNSEYRKANNL